ncbi:hypothetical protein [Natronobacterium texcoconense]|uniref:Uncharacterized protein n=1 Tax=Natronobacterium texcoconense TaxID=1095778 RepID=A0A1H1HNV0_NATTX|nr:hypothetical protein [Natronobacterium texcoconense]SDR27215.1 hypothetical protein SAMN04489842_2927 [Natronobacterium texcoconense]
MPLKRLLGSRATRSLTVVSVLKEAKRAFDRNKRTRALLLLGVAVLAWKWTVVGLAAQGVVKLLRSGRSSTSGSQPA